MEKIIINQAKRIRNFSYLLYNLILIPKFSEVIIKKFIKFVLISNDPQKKRFFWERLGILSDVIAANNKERWIWVHANSIGDVNACQSLICLIKDKYPSKQILLTTTNFSADQRAAQLNIADAITFFPYDIPFIIRRYLKIFKPVCFIVIESDIWPNFVKICNDRGIPVLVASGIYTEGNSLSLGLRHFYNYTFRLSQDVLKNVDCFCMQTEDDAKRLSSLIPDHKNINVSGNLKFGDRNNKLFVKESSYYQRLFNVKDTDPVFIAGNVHPIEEEMIIDAFRVVKKKIPDAVMILAPRFMKDISQIESLLQKKGLSYVKKTALGKQERISEDVILLDTMGELAKVYSMTKVAFVGGSLFYLGEMFGGHNILEPAQFGVPVIFGPYMHNWQRLADLFLCERMAIEVKDVRSLANSISDLMKDEVKRESIRLKSKEVFKANENVVEKTFDLLQPFLTDYPDRCEVCAGKDFKFLIRQGEYKIFRCKKCRLIFSHPLPSTEELDAFYQNFSYNQFESMYAQENAEIGVYVIKEQLKLLQLIGEDIRDGKFLDIGCGNGYYLYGAKIAGFEVFGVEKDKLAAEYGRHNYGVNILSCDLDECNFPHAYFNIIKMRQIIEHLRHPNEYLREVYRILKPGGILIVETVNTESLETIPRLYFLDAFKKIKTHMPELPLIKKLLLSLRREWGFTDPPRHLYGFSKANLKSLLSINDFRILKTSTAAMGDKVHYPISVGLRRFLYKNERDALERLYEKSKVKYLAYRFMFKPTMEVLKLYIKLFGLGSHLIVYAKKS